ncbi:MAG: peptide chain release factor 2 [Candidatus Dasytiphilus stammeri]
MSEKKLIKDRINNLIKRNLVLKKKLNYNLNKKLLDNINSKLEQPNIWHNTRYAQSLNKKSTTLTSTVLNIDNLSSSIEELSYLFDLAIEFNDIETMNEVINEINQLDNKIELLEYKSMFSYPNDHYDCYLDIQSGSGGIESQDWAGMLMRMYLRWAGNKGFKTEMIAESVGDIAGIKSATVKIIGKYAFGWLRTESGIHRLVRKSPFDSGGKRHTSFSSVFIYPDINKDINIEFNLSELRIDVYRASGAGGQHVNRTESAVRITHIPTGIVTQCQTDRSQHKNKEQAIKQMKAKLYALEQKKMADKKKIIEEKKSDIGWGRQIRSYVLDDSRVKDLRTGITTSNVQWVLDGNIDIFIEASLKSEKIR